MSAESHTPSSAVRSPEQIVRAVKHLPSAPKVLPRLKHLLRDGNSAIHEIVALVRVDPGLALRVMQVANSAYFYTGSRCFTVEEAVRRVGFDEVFGLVSHAVAVQVLNRPVVVYGMEADELWARSVACALGAEAIARVTGNDRAFAYTVGLLHGIGMVAIDEWAMYEGLPLHFVSRDYPREATIDERAQIGCTQAEVGAALLAQWDFPAEMVDPVKFQYAPGAATLNPRFASLLVAARWIRSALLSPIPAMLPPLPTATQLQPIRLRPAALQPLLAEVAQQFSAVGSVLDSVEEVSINRKIFPGEDWR